MCTRASPCARPVRAHHPLSGSTRKARDPLTHRAQTRGVEHPRTIRNARISLAPFPSLLSPPFSPCVLTRFVGSIPPFPLFTFASPPAPFPPPRLLPGSRTRRKQKSVWRAAERSPGVSVKASEGECAWFGGDGGAVRGRRDTRDMQARRRTRPVEGTEACALPAPEKVRGAEVEAKPFHSSSHMIPCPTLTVLSSSLLVPTATAASDNKMITFISPKRTLPQSSRKHHI